MDLHTDGQHDERRSKLLKKIALSVMKNGFQQLRMEDIAKHMDISRTTMYKHFSSKEEVIDGVVQVFVDYIATLEWENAEEDELEFGICFQKLYGQTLSIGGIITDRFIKDLQSAYPNLYDKLEDALIMHKKKALEFYKTGKDKEIFNPINENFILLQDDLLLREIINTKYLIYNQTSIRQVLYDYYQFQKIQLFKAEKLSIVDDSKIEPIIEHLVEKFNKTL
ncbi:TetR/AcrR family transcriptional regulator [Clostridium sp. BL-8]|uniref:TetR/AcrR family transcriptional regulator n=1 Tax=Clostridium sp. BL-8 TaxID=349938 RepID=UPI00098BFDCC|nr:TetR/AcrR family transcriptional regulator [Clostridium sp. BL-8]OOM76480.1 division inhibitor protein [Clostridium sp. BL-8]